MIKSEPRIETKVVGAEKSKENFVTYIVKVTAHIPPNLAVSWTVARRYEQFREFASMMEKKISKSKTALPKLTGKSVHASTQSLVSKRLKKLNAYLDELCRIPEVSHSHEWCCFLSSSFQDLFKIPMPAAYVASYSSYQSTEQPTSSSYQTDAFIEPSSLSSSVSEVGSYIGGPSSFMPSYLGSASTSSSGSSSASSASSPTSTSSSSSSTFSTTSTTSPPSPRLEKRPSISLDKPPVITKPPKKEGKDKDQLLQTIQELERKLDTQKTETRRALEQTSTVRRENEDLHQRVQQYSQRTHELESDIKQYVTEIRWVPDADRNTCPYCKTAEIGRAVQQECRDRSRMPSSA
eukprot:TRINITY_DN9939_c0_g1_i7.p1 TRINITY_DN9939_c0_g1~~TRINITY_DN9939_c0_g1_i7.p1  ORF type:complete len:350 (-),score=22.70 TRINITY_DN9939_c0_g1_i7:27-1076(-)